MLPPRIGSSFSSSLCTLAGVVDKYSLKSIDFVSHAPIDDVISLRHEQSDIQVNTPDLMF